ncbi:MAG: hypothetical protein QOH60_2430 [Mycobacterium sp.]|jgi:hypothetical protein|nr:hypothetical protein [Mycobacterium sp.]
MATATRNSTLLTLSAAVVALAVAGCNGASTKPQTSPSSPSGSGSTAPASTSSQPVTTTSPTTTAQAAGTITLEVTGSGDVYAIWAEPFGSLASDHATLPFSKSFPLPADLNYVALNWTSRDDNPKGCKITVDTKVVVEHPPAPAGVEPCVFQR